MKIAIVGGGPTGLATALSLAQKGFSSTLYERKSWPVDKVCGEGIMPSGVKILEKLGLFDVLSVQDYGLFYGIRYLDPNLDIPPVEGEFSSGHGIGIKRSTLSRGLWELAKRESRIQLRPYSEVQGIAGSFLQILGNGNTNSSVSNSGNCQAKVLRQEGPFDLILACDGLHSKIRKILKWDKRPPIRQRRMGARVHFHCPPWTDKVEVWWGKGVEAYVTPNSKSSLELAFIWDTKRWKKDVHSSAGLLQQLLGQFPELQKKLSLDKSLGNFQGIGPLAQSASKLYQGPVLLMGDAYLFLDGITGEGISMGLTQAEDLAQVLSQNHSPLPRKLQEYSKRVKPMFKNYTRMTQLALFLTRHPFLRKLAMKLLHRSPRLFDHILEVNMGHRSLFQIDLIQNQENLLGHEASQGRSKP